jgi:hypothetical protein
LIAGSVDITNGFEETEWQKRIDVGKHVGRERDRVRR